MKPKLLEIKLSNKFILALVLFYSIFNASVFSQFDKNVDFKAIQLDLSAVPSDKTIPIGKLSYGLSKLYDLHETRKDFRQYAAKIK